MTCRCPKCPAPPPAPEYRWEWKLGPPNYRKVVFNLTVAEMRELAKKVAATAAEYEG